MIIIDNAKENDDNSNDDIGDNAYRWQGYLHIYDNVKENEDNSNDDNGDNAHMMRKIPP